VVIAILNKDGDCITSHSRTRSEIVATVRTIALATQIVL
jgi:hypothetical protein